jgi:hypothetical protein
MASTVLSLVWVVTCRGDMSLVLTRVQVDGGNKVYGVGDLFTGEPCDVPKCDVVVNECENQRWKVIKLQFVGSRTRTQTLGEHSDSNSKRKRKKRTIKHWANTYTDSRAVRRLHSFPCLGSFPFPSSAVVMYPSDSPRVVSRVILRPLNIPSSSSFCS